MDAIDESLNLLDSALSPNSPQTPLETYLREINNTDLLSSEDEQKIASLIAQGDPEARDLMVKANLRLVVSIARGYMNKGLSLPDLIEEGNLGLMRAVEGFDPDMGTRFSTYASYWIKQSIKRALINTSKPIRIPAYMVELLSKWRRASARLSEELRRNPSPEEIAHMLALPKKKLSIVKKAIHIYNRTPQFEQPEAGRSLAEMLMDENAKDPETATVYHDSLKIIFETMQDMDEQEVMVLKMRYGLDEYEPKTLKEISETLCMTRDRVRQIEANALARLYDSLNGIQRRIDRKQR